VKGTLLAKIICVLYDDSIDGYPKSSGDVWFPQPAPKDHPWRTMPHHRMTPHISGTGLSAQARYAAGVREIRERRFDKRPIRNEYLIVQDGKLVGVGAHSYSAGNATSSPPTRTCAVARQSYTRRTAPSSIPNVRNAFQSTCATICTTAAI
jgi:hypothetical protein